MCTTFGSTINLSNNTGSSFNPQISTTSNNVYVVWQDDSLSVNNTGNQDIFFKKNTDNGTTFGSTINLSYTTGVSHLTDLTGLPNNVYVVWADTNSTSGNQDIFFKKSTDNGTTFSSTINLSNNTKGETASDPHIVVSTSRANNSNYVYVTWANSIVNNQDIFFKKSTDNGTYLYSTINLSNNTKGETASDPHIVVSTSHEDRSVNDVYVTWRNSVSGSQQIIFTSVN